MSSPSKRERPTRKRARGRPQPSESTPTRPQLLLVGDESQVAPVAQALSNLEPGIATAPWSLSIARDLDPAVIAILLVAPLPRVPMRVAVRRLRDEGELAAIPIFAVVPGRASGSQIRGVYAAGATAVFQWPADIALLPRCLAETIAAVQVRGRAKQPDTALARTVRAHLKAVPGCPQGVRVQARDGVVFLSGQTDMLWKKETAVEVAAAVPGVRSVAAQGLRVAHAGVADRVVRQRIRWLLDGTSSIDESTLGVAVELGHVTLTGSVESRAELNRVVDLMAHVRGVRSIDKLTVVSSGQKKQDHQVAKRLRKMLSTRFTGADVQVAFFGNAAVLTGQVDSLPRRRAIERAVDDDDQVGRVVSKLEVS